MSEGNEAGRLREGQKALASPKEETLQPAPGRPSALYRRLFEAAHGGILILENHTGKVTDANPALLNLLGRPRDQVLGKKLWEIGLFKDGGLAVAAVEKLQKEGMVSYRDLPVEAADGRHIEVEFVGSIFEVDHGKAVQCHVRDITERRELEARLLEAEKMEAVGQLAGGAAHGYNNILTATLIELGMLLNDPTLPEGVRNLLRQLESDANRAADLTRQLLTFGRRQVINRAPLDLNELLARQVQTLQHLMGEHIVAEFAGGTEPLWIEADSRMIEQAVTNLGLNARDAMMPMGGRLTVGTALVEFDEAAAAGNPEARPGRFICISIADTGRGMDPQTLRHSFEPFFTTKEAGKGIGLGLSVVYGIAKQHEGWVEAASEMGRGSTFRVYLPAVAKAFAPPPEDVTPEISLGEETILVVEDEATVRDMVTMGLQLSGFRVLSAGSGEEAVKVWNEHAAEIDLLFTDMRMSGMTGMQLYEQLKREKNTLRVIISSGYSEEILKAEGHPDASVTFLPKPYGIKALGATVRQCLDRT
jgi:two-component system, cell cycle sensor histidine kinase and response regulator CckA